MIGSLIKCSIGEVFLLVLTRIVLKYLRTQKYYVYILILTSMVVGKVFRAANCFTVVFLVSKRIKNGTLVI